MTGLETSRIQASSPSPGDQVWTLSSSRLWQTTFASAAPELASTIPKVNSAQYFSATASNARRAVVSDGLRWATQTKSSVPWKASASREVKCAGDSDERWARSIKRMILGPLSAK